MNIHNLLISSMFVYEWGGLIYQYQEGANPPIKRIAASTYKWRFGKFNRDRIIDNISFNVYAGKRDLRTVEEENEH